MKKYLLLILLSSVVIFGCKRNDISTMDVNQISDLATLQNVITRVSEKMNAGKISMEEAEDLIDQLQQRYVDLTDTTENSIEDAFTQAQKIFDKKSITSYSLPLRAKKLGMTQPKGMQLNKVLSKQKYTKDNGYTSTVLVYKGDYAIALQQAKIIADKAKLHVSKDFAKAQSLAKVGNVDYISGLDIGALAQGIVYVNHELLETNIDNLLSVSVDQDGTLTLEATKYKN